MNHHTQQFDSFIQAARDLDASKIIKLARRGVKIDAKTALEAAASGRAEQVWGDDGGTGHDAQVFAKYSATINAIEEAA